MLWRDLRDVPKEVGSMPQVRGAISFARYQSLMKKTKSKIAHAQPTQGNWNSHTDSAWSWFQLKWPRVIPFLSETTSPLWSVIQFFVIVMNKCPMFFFSSTKWMAIFVRMLLLPSQHQPLLLNSPGVRKPDTRLAKCWLPGATSFLFTFALVYISVQKFIATNSDILAWMCRCREKMSELRNFIAWPMRVGWVDLPTMTVHHQCDDLREERSKVRLSITLFFRQEGLLYTWPVM